MKDTLKFFLAISFCFTALQAKEVSIATLNWEPYIGESLPNKGYVAEVIKAAFAVNGHEVDLEILPWARVIKMAENQAVNAYGPEYYSEDLKENYYLSNPFPGGPLVFFKRKDSNISYKTLNDLSSYKIGVVRGYVNTTTFDNASFLQKEESVNDITNFKKLIAGRIDLVVADKYVGLYLIKQKLPESILKIELLSPPLEEKKLYLCFPKEIPQSKQLRDDFNEGLSLIRINGKLNEFYSILTN